MSQFCPFNATLSLVSKTRGSYWTPNWMQPRPSTFSTTRCVCVWVYGGVMCVCVGGCMGALCVYGGVVCVCVGYTCGCCVWGEVCFLCKCALTDTHNAPYTHTHTHTHTLQAVFNVTKSRYPMTRDEYHDLAGLQATLVASESFDQNPNPSHYQSSLSKYYPSHMVPVETRKLGKLFKQKSVEGKDTPQLFVKSMKEVCTKKLEAYQLKVLYLQRCWQKPFYGSVFFKGQIKKPFKPVHLLVYTDKLVTVAINADCLHLFSVSAQPVSGPTIIHSIIGCSFIVVNPLTPHSSHTPHTPHTTHHPHTPPHRRRSSTYRTTCSPGS